MREASARITHHADFQIFDQRGDIFEGSVLERIPVAARIVDGAQVGLRRIHLHIDAAAVRPAQIVAETPRLHRSNDIPGVYRNHRIGKGNQRRYRQKSGKNFDRQLFHFKYPPHPTHTSSASGMLF